MESKKKIFSVPFNTNFTKYPDKIIERFHEHIAEVYMPMPSSLVPNARGSKNEMTKETLIPFAKYLRSKNIRPIVLFNSSWTPLEFYSDTQTTAAIELLKELYDNGIDKLVVGNYYLIAGGIFKNAVPGLDVVASINSRHDTIDKVMSHVAFTRPRSVYIDRMFNRKWKEFIDVATALGTLGIERTVLANEGCMYACPFKTDHDVQLGMSSYKGEHFRKYIQPIADENPELNDRILGLNTTIGCCNVYKKNPWYLLKSPFIRPEDLDKYLPYIDIIKIAGRNRSTDWIANVLQAYINRSYDGSLLDLLDVADVQDLGCHAFPNKNLDGLVELTANCHKICMVCGKCKKFYDERCLGIQSAQVTEDDLTPEVEQQIHKAMMEGVAKKDGDSISSS